jgi:hypothetical protein
MYITGIDPTAVQTSAQGPAFSLGALGFNMTSAGPKGYIYVQADSSGITGDGYVADISAAFAASMNTTTTGAPGTGGGKLVGVARAAIAASGYGWLQVFGAGVVRVAASCAAYTILNTTATAGQIDDDATTGARVIDGIVLSAANGGSAGTAAGWMNWPKIGRTL